MAWGIRAHGALIYTRARVTAGDDGGASVVLRRLGRRMYGRRCGQTWGPLHARCAYGGVAARFEASWGRGERREAWASGSARPRAEESSGRRAGTAIKGRPAPAGDARRAGARPDTMLLNLVLKLNFSKNLNKSALTVEHESCTSNYPLSLSKRLYGVFLHRF
jgi:hypothetical protein